MTWKQLTAFSAVAVAGAFVASIPVQAQTPQNALRLNAGYIVSSNDIDDITLDIDDEDDPDSIFITNNAWDQGWGIGAAYEFRTSPLIGIQVGGKYFRPELDLGSRTEKVAFAPLTAGLNFHFGTSDKFDFYVGPMAAYVFYGDFDFEFTTVGGARAVIPIELDNELTWGGTIGMDFGLGENMALSISADYIAADAEIKADQNTRAIGLRVSETRPRPIFLNAGVTFRF